MFRERNQSDRSKCERSVLTDAEKFSDNLFLVTETNLDAIHGYLVNLNPDLLILDSIQTTYIPTKDSSAGTVTQVRECSSMLREYAKSTGTSVFLIGTCDEGWEYCGTEDIGTNCGYGALFGGRSLPELSVVALGEESLWGDF